MPREVENEVAPIAIMYLIPAVGVAGFTRSTIQSQSHRICSQSRQRLGDSRSVANLSRDWESRLKSQLDVPKV